MDSTIFNEVKIGKQVWMAENLNVAIFRNGDPIPEAITADEWKKAGKNKQPAWCYYDDDLVYGHKYGKLYNWYAVNDPRGLAPQGYHISTDAEWTTLTTYLGEEEAGAKMKSRSGWDVNGTNISGFNGLPGGYRDYRGTLHSIELAGYWWSSTEYDTIYAWNRYLFYYYGSVARNFSVKGGGLSVRCLRD